MAKMIDRLPHFCYLCMVSIIIQANVFMLSGNPLAGLLSALFLHIGWQAREWWMFRFVHVMEWVMPVVVSILLYWGLK